jgi:hypothetical protein
MKRDFLFLSFVVPCVLIIFSMCTKDIGKPMSGPSTTGGPTVPTADSCKTNIKFATQIQPILNTYCAINNPQCHASTNSWGNFTTYGGFVAKKTIVVGRIKDPTANKMPAPYTTGPTTLTDCEISKIESWINAGALNN